MATPRNSFQQQRAAIMSSGGLDPSLAQTVTSGIAALTSNANAAASALSRIGPTQTAPIESPAEAIAKLSPAEAQQYLSQMPAELRQQTLMSNEGLQALSRFGGDQQNIAAKQTGAMNSGEGGTLAQLLHKHEGAGDYDTLFGHSQREGGRFAGIKPSQMTIGEVLAFQNPNGQYGQWVKSELARQGQTPRIATPIGAGQIVGSTLRNAANAMGLSHNTPFNAQTQDSIINYLASQRLRSANSWEAARAGLRAEWEGFRGVSNNQLDQAIRQLGFNF